MTIGTYVFLRKYYKNPRRESNQNLAPIATGPYKVTAREANTVTIERENLEKEKASRDGVVGAPIPMYIVIAESEQPESGTPPTEVDVEATPDSISVFLQMNKLLKRIRVLTRLATCAEIRSTQ